MPYGPVPVTDPCYGIDTAIAGALTEAQLQAMLTTPLGKTGQCPKVLCGYVPLPGNRASRWDMTAAQLTLACDMGWLVWLVQHCRGGSWVASAEQGAEDGEAAATYANSIGYPTGCHLAADDEAVRSPAPSAFQHFTAWCSKWPTPMIYEGFSPGMSPEQEYEIPDVQAYWGAAGPWNVATRGVRARQGLTVVHCGVEVDPDWLAPDHLGGVLVAMGKIG